MRKEDEAILALRLRKFLGGRQVSQAQLQKYVANNPSMYVGTTRRGDASKRLDEHGRSRGDFKALWAPSSDMKRDEKSLLNMSVGNAGNQNIAKTSGISQGRSGWTYALYPVAAAGA